MANNILNETSRLKSMKQTIQLLPPKNLHSLKYLVMFLKEISDISTNKMNVTNLAVCIGPNLIVEGRRIPSMEDTALAIGLMKTMIKNAIILFE